MVAAFARMRVWSDVRVCPRSGERGYVLLAFRLGRGDQPKFAVENPRHGVKVLGLDGISGCLQQLLLRPHVALDVRADVWEQGFQDRLSCFLVQAVLRRGSRGGE